MWVTTVMPASFTRAQKGSKSSWPGLRGPWRVKTALGRMTTMRASRSSAHSSCAHAQSTSASVM
jgi:hypothetical protein